MSNPSDSTGHSTFEELHSQISEYLKRIEENNNPGEPPGALKDAHDGLNKGPHDDSKTRSPQQN